MGSEPDARERKTPEVTVTIEPMSWVPKRPSGLPVRAEYIPRLLHKLMGWVLWRYERRKRKWTKVPFRPDGNRASTTDPRTWSDFGTVLNAYRERAWDGIGFVLSAYPDLVGIDLDKCWGYPDWRDRSLGTGNHGKAQFVHGAVALRNGSQDLG